MWEKFSVASSPENVRENVENFRERRRGVGGMAEPLNSNLI